MDPVLEHKVVAVTGGLGALGQAVVRALRAAGARVAVLDRMNAPAGVADPDVLVQGGIDLADGAQADAALERAAAELGGLDSLVNIVGTFRWETLE